MRDDAGAALLFSYDRLREPGLQIDLLGRVLEGEDDVLAGFTVDFSRGADARDAEEDRARTSLPIARRTGNRLDKVIGRVLALSEDELDVCDEYEEPRHRRILVELASGREAWMYVDN